MSAFRRAIRIESRPGRVQAELEDDFHRFGVSLAHDGEVVARIEARAGRYPWATCAEAPAALAALARAPLSPNPARLFQHADPRAHCTHLFELAALAVGRAARGEGYVLLEAEVSDPEGGARRARLFEDGAQVVDWRLAGETITAPEAEAGLVSRFTSRVLAELAPVRAERLLLLRRVVQTARGRQIDVDRFATAAEMGRPAACYSLQPEAAVRARRVEGTVRDWPDRESLTRSLQS